ERDHHHHLPHPGRRSLLRHGREVRFPVLHGGPDHHPDAVRRRDPGRLGAGAAAGQPRRGHVAHGKRRPLRGAGRLPRRPGGGPRRQPLARDLARELRLRAAPDDYHDDLQHHDGADDQHEHHDHHDLAQNHDDLDHDQHDDPRDHHHPATTSTPIHHHDHEHNHHDPTTTSTATMSTTRRSGG